MAENDCSKTELEDSQRGGSGYDFSKVDPGRVYTLSEAACLVGMSYQEALRAASIGRIHAVRSTWNSRRLFVKGEELLRVMRDEFVEVAL